MISTKYLAVLYTVCLLQGCSSNKDKSQSTSIISVRVGKVSPSEITPDKNYIGTVEESSSTELSFEVDGNIAAIHCKEGQLVQAGQLVASLDNTVYKESYDMASAAFEQSDDAYKRLKSVHESGSLPEIEWVEAGTNRNKAMAMANIAKKKLGNCILYAPYKGLIAKKYVETGTNVMPGIPVYKLVSIDDINIKVAIPEKEISSLSIGQKAIVQVAALNGSSFSGEIVEKGVIANSLSHTYEIKIQIKNTEMELLPGMVCQVTLDNTSKENQIVIPSELIRIGSNKEHYVWVVIQGIAKKRTVVPGEIVNSGSVVIGLQEGDSLIVEGYQHVSDGMSVSIK